MIWEIRYRSSVEKDVSRLPADIRESTFSVVASLAHNPFPQGCKKLRGSTKRWRLRIAGQYRIVYSVWQNEKLIKVEFIGHRKDAYRWF